MFGIRNDIFKLFVSLSETDNKQSDTSDAPGLESD